jgi:dTDP-4-dehydrorhamnose 3,5-epimerase
MPHNILRSLVAKGIFKEELKWANDQNVRGNDTACREGERLPKVIFFETIIRGAYIIELEQCEDERGFFARSWCEREFEAHRLSARMVQGNISFNRKKGTLRGMHYQRAPHEEAKLVRCTRGSIYDVIIDVRPESPTYMKWTGVRLKADDYRMVYVPGHCAHGFLTLEGDTEVSYLVSEFYTPEAEQGVRWDDPLFRIAWPDEVSVISDKDRVWPDFVAGT